MAKQNFDAIFEALTDPNLSNEGTKWFPGNADDPNPTQSGITQNAYNRYLTRNGLGAASVQGITDAQRSAITREDYWNRISGDQLPPGLDYQALDIAFNAGIPRAAYLMKQALGLPLLGTSSANEPWTSDIMANAQAAYDDDPQGAISAFTDARHELYNSFKNADKFPGWFTRADNVGDASLRLAAQGPIGITRDVPGPPGRPNDGSAGITPRPSEVVRAIDDASDSVTQGLADAFEGLTGRLPTPEEFKGRLNDIKTGASNFFDQITGIAGSREAKSHAETTGFDPEKYVIQQAYKQATGRDPSDAEVTQNLSVLKTGGASLSDLAKGIAGSQEGQTYALGNFYQNAFGRQADSPGLQNALSQLGSGKSLTALETELLGSPEAQARGITADQFANYLTPGYLAPTLGSGTTAPVIGNSGISPTIGAPAGTSVVNDIYQAILGRPGDAAGLQAFDAQLDSGKMDLNQIQAILRGSDEAKTLGSLGEARTYSPLDTVFARQLDRMPDATAIESWGSAPSVDPIEATVYGSPEAQTYRAGLGDLASIIRNPTTAPTIGPTPGQSITATPGIGNFDFSSAYLAQNKDVAAAGMNPWEHFLRYGAQEGRALNTAGDRFDPNAYLAQNVDVQQAGQDALTHYLSFGAAEGRAAPLIGADGTVHNVASLGVTPTLSASLAPYLHPQGMAPNVPAPFGQTIGPSAGQSVTASPGIGDYDFASNYLTANADVAAAGMNPWEHFLRFGAKEGRAINAAGDRFDPNAYLSENADVRDAGQDALTHFLTWGANEGRDAPIIGADGVTRDIGNLGVTPTITASLMPFLQPQTTAPLIGPPDAVQAWSPGTVSPFGFGGNVSQGVGNGSFGSGITPTPQISPYGFSGLNPSGFLGATAQGLGSSYAVGSAASLGFGGTGGGGGSGGDGTIDPFGFGGDVSGFDVNNLGGSAVPESASAGGYGDGVAIQGRNNQASQNAFIAGEWKKAADSTAAANLLGQQITNVAPGNQTNYALGAINPMQTPSIQQTPFTPVNMSGVFAPMPTAMFMPRFGGW